MNNSEVFLEIAKSDLKAAECLYKQKLYSQAVFFLQQSVEKGLITFALIMKYISIMDLEHKYSRGHNLLKFYIDLSQQLLDKKKISESRHKKFKEVCNLIQNDRLDMISPLSPLKFTNRITKLNKKITKYINRYHLYAKNKSKSVWLQPYNNFKKGIKQYIKSRLDENSASDYIKDVIKQDILKIAGSKALFFRMVLPAFLLHAYHGFAIIVLPHAIATRYPKGQMNPQWYNKKRAIVRKLPLLMNVHHMLLMKIRMLAKSQKNLQELLDKFRNRYG